MIAHTKLAHQGEPPCDLPSSIPPPKTRKQNLNVYANKCHETSISEHGDTISSALELSLYYRMISWPRRANILCKSKHGDPASI